MTPQYNFKIRIYFSKAYCLIIDLFNWRVIPRKYIEWTGKGKDEIRLPKDVAYAVGYIIRTDGYDNYSRYVAKKIHLIWLCFELSILYWVKSAAGKAFPSGYVHVEPEKQLI